MRLLLKISGGTFYQIQTDTYIYIYIYRKQEKNYTFIP